MGKGCGAGDAEGAGEVCVTSGQCTLERIPRRLASACRLTATAATTGETDSSVSPPTLRTGRNTSLHKGAATDSLTITSLELSDPVGNTSLAYGEGRMR